MIRVLVADDHDLVRVGIVRVLQDSRDVEVVAQATSGEEAIRYCKTCCPDVVLMDVRMPGIGGLEATRRIVQANPKIKVIAVSALDSEIFPSRLIQAGALGYVSKSASLDEMLLAIKRVQQGQRYLSADVAEQLALRAFDNSLESSPFEKLSERELQISMMVVNCQKVQDISLQLHLSPKTVNSYRYRIFEKLGISSDVELTHLAIRYGMVDSEVI